MVWQEAQQKLEENTQQEGEQLPEPTQINEIDDMLGIGPRYDPLTDTLTVPKDQEETKPVEKSLIIKYTTDQIIGNTGKQTIRELNQQIPTYQDIKNGDILKGRTPELSTTEEMDEQFREVFGEEPPETSLETDVDPNEIISQNRQLGEKRLRKQLGKNEQINERLATLHLSSNFTETIQQYQQEYQQLEQEKEEAQEEFSQFENQYWNELEQTLSDDALEEIVELEVQEMETQMEIFDRTEENKTEEEKIKELEAGVDPTEILNDTGNYQREDIAEILRRHGYEQHTDQIYEMMRERDRREEEKDQTIEQLGDRQLELSTELMDELDKEKEKLSSEIDMYLEPIKQRKFQLQQQPVKEIASALYAMYETHVEGEFKDPETYLQRAREQFQDTVGTPDAQNYFDELTSVYQEAEGDIEERLQKVFQQVQHLNQ